MVVLRPPQGPNEPSTGNAAACHARCCWRCPVSPSGEDSHTGTSYGTCPADPVELSPQASPHRTCHKIGVTACSWRRPQRRPPGARPKSTMPSSASLIISGTPRPSARPHDRPQKSVSFWQVRPFGTGVPPVGDRDVPRQVVGRVLAVSKLGMVGSAIPRWTSTGRFQHSGRTWLNSSR
jgi:hypothetical protein